MATVIQNFRVDAKLKEEFSKVSEALGLTTSSMLTAFMKKTVAMQAIPFPMTVKPLSEKRVETRKKITEFYHTMPAIDLDDAKNLEEFSQHE